MRRVTELLDRLTRARLSRIDGFVLLALGWLLGGDHRTWSRIAVFVVAVFGASFISDTIRVIRRHPTRSGPADPPNLPAHLPPVRDPEHMLKRASALRGITPGKYFSPFYDHARRFAGLSPATVDAYLAARGRAEISAGGVITLAAQGLGPHFANVAPQHRQNMTRWVNQFNDRSARG